MKDLNGKWVLITGAGSGIGRAMALEFARQGANIIIADIDEEKGKKTASEIGAMAKVICVRTDVSRPEEIQSLVRSVLENPGRVDVLVNNAGIGFVCDIKDITWEEWERILAINLLAYIQLVHHLLPHMIARGNGHIVNIASMAGLIGIPGLIPYTTTKFGLVGYSEALRIELSLYGIGVTAVCPGIVNTPILVTSVIKGFKQEMRNTPPFLMITPEKAAKIIVCGVKRNKARVIPTVFIAKLLYLVHIIAPRLSEYVRKIGYSRFEREP